VNRLIEAGADINKQNINGSSPLFSASGQGHIQIVEILLKHGASKDIPNNKGKKPIDVAKTSKIKELLNDLITDDNKWRGWTRSDVEKFDILFTDEGALNYSCCPICLKYVLRQDGCLYMHHNCSALQGFYHKELYNKYKDRRGKIEWCTVCGRICKEHRHFKLNIASDSVPGYAVPPQDTIDVFFQNDCRGANGGGGLPEKIERVRALRQFARELQEVVGEISQTKALEELTEAMWNAPAASAYSRRSQKILTTKKWNFETADVFPPNVIASNTTNNIIPNIPRPEANRNLLPTFRVDGSNNISMNDEVPVVYFHHRLPDGTVKNHSEGIGLHTLTNFIQDTNTRFGTEDFGQCPFQCGARLHPDEVVKAFELLESNDVALVAEYRAKFNRKFRGT
jgi:predicted phosphatase